MRLRHFWGILSILFYTAVVSWDWTDLAAAAKSVWDLHAAATNHPGLTGILGHCDLLSQISWPLFGLPGGGCQQVPD